jgi:hypothetical protein
VKNLVKNVAKKAIKNNIKLNFSHKTLMDTANNNGENIQKTENPSICLNMLISRAATDIIRKSPIKSLGKLL